MGIVLAPVTIVSTFDELRYALGDRHSCLTIGVFDGVHLGHQALVERTVAAARKQAQVSVVVTFKNHPLAVLAPPYTPRRLVTNARKADLLRNMGVEIVVLLEFTRELASTPPEDFVNDYLVSRGRLHSLICGYDFSFGCQGAGTIELLKTEGSNQGFTVECVSAVSHENRIVKSTHVRDLLFAGHVSEATQLLSRPHEVPGIVGSGMKRGRTIGFPTANLTCPENYQLPAQGVYLCGARIGTNSEILPAMVNIGTSPTFGENQLTVEAHLLDFSGDLHGSPLTLYFIERLRDERKFPGIDALVEQLTKDREQSGSLWKTDAIQKIIQLVPTAIDHQL